ncbi:MAG TPA: topoisomerase C-terminal repeat-containing protein, partial [Fimbriimonadaceae bacterium]|nr:topoisomerase C-terminal repeat-containing protein [Fimbriimonadaceae bacterium]
VTGRRLLLKNKGGYYLEAERTPEEIEKKEKPRWISVPPGMTPAEMTQEVLDQLCQMPRDLGKHPETGEPVLVKIGKFGAYVENGVERRTITEWQDALTVDLDRAVELLKMPKHAAARATRKAAEPLKDFGTPEGAAGHVRILAGRFGPYVTDGTTNATIPRGTDPEAISVEQALEMLRVKAAAGPAPKKKFARKGASPKGRKKK